MRRNQYNANFLLTMLQIRHMATNRQSQTGTVPAQKQDASSAYLGGLGIKHIPLSTVTTTHLTG